MVGPSSYHDDYYYYDSYSPSVDCTLSLGTPSTRRSSISDDQDHRRSDAGEYGSWDFHPQSNQRSSKAAARSHRGGSSGVSGGDDALLARRCANCDTTSTPLWRNGPRGPKSLCNACGIRYKKEERRASAAAAATNVASVASGSGGTTDNHTGAAGYYNGTLSSWSHHYFSPPVTMGSNEYDFVDDVDNRDSDSGIQYATWHFNVPGHAYQPC